MSVPLAVLAIVLAMITPLPSFLLDILISANITISVIVLLVSMYITRPVEFSVFPTALLLLTLFRLALNISSSRLILMQGNTGTRAAGQVIEAFGNFVVGGNYIIGVVIFLVLIAIQYVVINHGAVRISEVTARFTLDALPGKQMSIDSDLNAGLIDEHEARARRKNLAAEAEFYGAMDGASRFTQRDAVASILITTINIVAGFLIGVFQNGMDLKRALATYTVLTIGDGLVTVIPALMVSVSGGLIVTRTSSDGKVGADVRKQVFSNPQPLMLSGARADRDGGVPGTADAAVSDAGIAEWDSSAGGCVRNCKTGGGEAEPSAAAPAKDNLETLLKVEPLAVEVGLGLVKLVEGAQNSPLLRRIAGIRRQMATDLGYMVPPVRVTDNLQLKACEYVVLLKGAEIARFELMQNRELAIHPGGTSALPLEGIADQRAGVRNSGAVDSIGNRRRRARQGIHRGRRRQRSGHASGGIDPAARLRTAVAAGHQEYSGPRGGRKPQSDRRFGSEIAPLGDRAEGFAESVAGASFDSGFGDHSGSAGRGGGDDQESDPAHRICAPGDPPQCWSSRI